MLERVVENFELVQLKNGVMSLRALQPRETFHPGVGPAEEAEILHVNQHRLLERAMASESFILWDVGLGAAANAIAALRALESMLRPKHGVRVLSFDKTLSPLQFALENAEALKYPIGFETHIRKLLDKGSVEVSPGLIWELDLGDFSRAQGLGREAPDSIFYDPYSPVSNPEMWTLPNFTRLYQQLDPEKLCLVSTYTRSTQIRVSLLLAGFSVGIGCLVHEKDETTICSNRLEALERPLDRVWLEKRVSVSHNAAPLRANSYQVAPIGEADYEALKKLPQFQ